MGKLKPLALIGLVLGPLFLSSSIESSFAFERSSHAIAIILAIVGSSLVISSRFLDHHLDTRPHSRSPSRSSHHAYSVLPLENVGNISSPPSSSRSPSPDLVTPGNQHTALSPSRLRLTFLLLVVALSLRVETIRRIIGNVQCSGHSYTMLIPFLFAAIDFWRTGKQLTSSRIDDIDANIFELVCQYWTKTNLKYVVPAAVLASTSGLIVNSNPTLSSTFICPAVTLARSSVALSTMLALPLDFLIIFSVSRLLKSSSRDMTLARPLRIIGYANMATALVMVITAIFYYIFLPEDRSWMLSLPPGFIPSVSKLAILACITTISLCLTIYLFGPLISTAIVVFVTTTTASIGSSLTNTQPFPPVSGGLSYMLYCCALIAFAALVTAHSGTKPSHHGNQPLFIQTPEWFWGLLLIFLIARTTSWLTHVSNVSFHPVDMLVSDAKMRHTRYIAHASSSTSLSDAVREYKMRYKRYPPPGFDRWYEYAAARNNKIVDDFDQIYEDLLPHWAVSPVEIRQRTWRAISNPWNDVAGISIRNGSAAISPNVMPTHRWMLDGIIEMVNHFGEWLPDMDLGFNLNDECRIAAPYESIQGLRKAAKSGESLISPKQHGFSDGRADLWAPIPAEPIKETPFTELSFQRTWSQFGTAACPPDSPARSRKHWDTSRICTSCIAGHSWGAFMSNWTSGADICQQPDMENLHGFYLSPAAYKASHELFPVFSQSKVPGYNDILYPSPWNYLEKAKYEPNDEHPDIPFEKKANTLFWRGGTSEGVSPGSGTWKGMARQRFIHLANNINNTTPAQPILLPHPSSSKTQQQLRYNNIPTRELTKHLSVDVHIVETIVRCGGQDCPDQSLEFAPLAQPIDFQSHWAHKYLLDLDGAGFSGRFLPFLFSRSLPFKAALFREWYDSRLTPWLHFVPLDLRGHGFWATLVYFMGLEGVVGGRVVNVAAHEAEAGVIAHEGREWARSVLRKEDMEIYFFRLLLEWGRVTDDRRDEMGFVLVEEEEEEEEG